jgi:transposase
MARKTKLTDELEEKLCEYIMAGNYANTAASMVGIDESTYYRWIRKGEAAKSGRYYQFNQSIKKAEKFAEAYHIQNIRKAGGAGAWTASAWWLERKYPQRWGKQERVELNHSGNLNQDIKATITTDEYLRKKRQKIDEILSQDDPVYNEETPANNPDPDHNKD